MSNKLRVIVVILILIIFSGFIYLLLSNNIDESNNKTATSKQSAAPVKQENKKKQGEGRYVDYSADMVANTDGKRILFFHAAWCPQCRQLEASIKAEVIPNDVTIFKVDYDSNQKLRQQYGVTIQTTLVLLDDKGVEVKKYVAYDNPSLNAVIENLL